MKKFLLCRQGCTLRAFLSGVIVCFAVSVSHAAELADTVSRVKPSIVGVGSHHPTRAPQSRLVGTGFAVGDGYHVVTNAHVVDLHLSAKANEKLVVFIGTGSNPQVRSARILAIDKAHDLALLRLTGTRLPAMKLTASNQVREGQSYAFTGFPIGSVLGLYPVTHQGVISSITPIATPAAVSGQLTAELIQRLKSPYTIFQLDATAYPGNSGSPLYNQQTGEVVGVINKVFVKGTKETVLSDPSGITYAIPSRYVLKLLENAGLKEK